MFSVLSAIIRFGARNFTKRRFSEPKTRSCTCTPNEMSSIKAGKGRIVRLDEILALTRLQNGTFQKSAKFDLSCIMEKIHFKYLPKFVPN